MIVLYSLMDTENADSYKMYIYLSTFCREIFGMPIYTLSSKSLRLPHPLLTKQHN